MSTKDKLLRRPQSFVMFRDTPAGNATTVAAANAAGAATVTVASATGIAAGKSFRYGSGELIERVEVASVAALVVTLVKPLARDHAAADAFVEQTGYNLGAVKGAITPTQATTVTDVTSALQRLVFQRVEGFETITIDATVHGFTLENFAVAMGIPLPNITGNGLALATPKVLASDMNDIDTVDNVCLLATYVLQDGTIKTQEFWGVYPDYTAFSVQLGMGQDGAMPMKFSVFGMGIEQDGAPTYVPVSTIKATKGKVFSDLTGVGLFVQHATPGLTTVGTAAAKGDTTLVLADASAYAGEDFVGVGVDDTFEIVWVESVASETLTLKTPLFRAQAVGVTVQRLSQLPFAAIGKDGVKFGVGGQTAAIQNGLRRLPIGSQPGLVDVTLAISLLELSLANRAYALGIPQSAIDVAHSRLVLSEKIGTATVLGAYLIGTLKDGTINRIHFWSPVQDLASIATAFGDANGAVIPWSGKVTSGVQFLQYAG